MGVHCTQPLKLLLLVAACIHRLHAQHVGLCLFQPTVMCHPTRRHPLLQGSASALRPSADAAVRLAALEVSTQQTAAQLTTTARQMDKLQARVRTAAVWLHWGSLTTRTTCNRTQPCGM
jgi:hypothetical protein